jgi:hypothetical protein
MVMRLTRCGQSTCKFQRQHLSSEALPICAESETIKGANFIQSGTPIMFTRRSRATSNGAGYSSKPGRGQPLDSAWTRARSSPRKAP